MSPYLIFIISVSYDHTTNVVIDWLKYAKKDFLRLNENEKINNVSICSSNEGFNIPAGASVRSFQPTKGKCQPNRFNQKLKQFFL
jgi:hypothetical protein